MVTVVSAVVSLVYAVSGYRAAEGAGVLPSLYALARSVALVAIAVVAPFTGSVGFVAASAVAMVCVQAMDAVIGRRTGDRVKTLGPAITAALNALALIAFLST